MKLRAFVLLLATGLLACSCKSTGGIGVDAGTDAGPDADGDPGGDPGGDPETDADRDAGGDLEADAGQDAGGDLEADAGQDAGGDLEGDAGPDGDGASEHVQNGCLGAETLSLDDVAYQNPAESAIVGWTETATLSSVVFSNDILDDIAVILDYDKRDGTEWEDVGGSVANAWVFYRDENDNHNWHGKTWEWMRPNQTVKYATGIRDVATPAQGECIGIMMSGLIRAGPTVANASERSNIVFVEWPW